MFSKVPDVSDRRTERIEGTLDELLASLMDSEPGSMAHEQVKAAVAVRVAEIQRETADEGEKWARISASATAGATLIALVALLVAVF